MWWHLLALAATAFWPASAARHARPDGVADGGSLAQLRDTLQNLQRSVEDSGHEAEGLFAGRQRWCDESLRAFAEKQGAADASLRHMTVDIKEQQAAAEEADGAARQLKADIAIVQHTLNKTMSMLEAWRGEEADEQKLNSTLLLDVGSKQKQLQADESLLQSLVRNKQQTLAALEGEEEVILPMLAQLQAGVIELRVQLTDRGDSVLKEGRFIAALRDACSRSSDRAQLQAAARAKTTAPLAAALQAVEKISASKAASQPLAASLAPEAPSFFQRGSEQPGPVADDDLLEVFGGQSQATGGVAGGQTREASRGGEEEAEGGGARPWTGSTAVSRRPKIRQLLSDLSSDAPPRDDKAEWCSEEQTAHERAVMLAEASISEMDAELSVHADSVDQIEAGLRLAETSSEALGAAAKEVAASLAKEQALIAECVKDQTLAVRILAQARDVLEDLRAADGVAEGEEHGAGGISSSLQAAEAAFKAHARAAGAARQEVAETAQKLAQEAKETLDALEHERANLELARDSHSSERRRCTQNKAMYESDVKEAKVFLTSLKEECASGVLELQEREHEAEVRALQDSEAVLEGRPMSRRPQATRGLRGAVAASTPQPRTDLSPLQRAAEEMGVAIDDDN